MNQAEQALIIDLATTVHLVDLTNWISIGIWNIILKVLLRLFLKNENLILFEVLDGSIKDEIFTPFEAFIEALSHNFAR